MKRFLVATILGIILVVGAVYLTAGRKSTKDVETQTAQPSPQTKSLTFANSKKTPHWESNTPEHGSALAGIPVNIVINFNFDLADNSSISIQKDGMEYGLGETQIDDNKLVLRRKIDPLAPDGFYTVTYKACWPDKTCHDGNFQFAIDRTKSQEIIDMRGQKEIAVNLTEISFKPQSIRISKGTKVVWTNNDTVEHYVNTDSHPAHTYFSKQNSKVLKTDDIFSVIFDEPGFYPYHCSAHAASMKASILIE